MNPARPKSDLPPPPGRFSFVPITLAFAVIGAGFVATTVYGEIEASAIDKEAAQIELDALPSVEHVSAARTSLRHLEVEADQYAEQTIEARESAGTAVEEAREQLDRALMDYLALPAFAGERDLYPAVKRTLGELDDAIGRMKRLAGHDEAQAKLVADRDVRGAVERVDAALRSLIDLNAARAHTALLNIARVRQRTLALTLVLDAVCVLLSITAAFVALRALRRQADVERTHEKILEERADELEVFAKRVAHDLLSPLSALSFTLSAVKRGSERGQPVTESITRAFACLQRSQRLVDGILDFARSGTAPTTGARADLREAVEGVLDEIRADEATRAELVVAPFEDAELACAPGVLVSVLANLVRNAVKYMGDRPVRRVTVRVATQGRSAHVEVEDTGPGLPPGLEPHVFEPYVRAPDNASPGLGLGLSTVRRLVEAHGGRVGVRSEPEIGCVFWFELPLASRPSRAEEKALSPA